VDDLLYDRPPYLLFIAESCKRLEIARDGFRRIFAGL